MASTVDLRSSCVGGTDAAPEIEGLDARSSARRTLIYSTAMCICGRLPVQPPWPA